MPVSLIPKNELAAQVETIVREVINSLLPDHDQRLVPISISARHLHIKQEHLELLFGPGYQLTKLRDLLQPGEFAANETVTVVGQNRRIFEKVRILGPTRHFTQVELPFTDGRYLGIDLPARHSGDLKNSAPIVLIGPAGVLRLEEGAIRALRHIHINQETADRWGLKNKQMVSIQTRGPTAVAFKNVLIRIGKNANLEMHIDTDEANAAGLTLESNQGILI